MSNFRWAVLAIAALTACGEPKQPASPEPPAAEAPSTNPVRANVLTVDLEGHPLPGMQPIATLQRNAFDAPLVRGTLSNAEGKCSIALPRGQRIYVRAWDPNLRYFANNYYDVLPEEGTYTEDMTIHMAAGASLTGKLLRQDSQPAAESEVAIMLVHPSEGPWWPDKARTDTEGIMRFPALPAGEYSLQIRIEPGLGLEVPGVALRPGAQLDMGPLTLQ